MVGCPRVPWAVMELRGGEAWRGLHPHPHVEGPRPHPPFGAPWGSVAILEGWSWELVEEAWGGVWGNSR